MLFKFYSDIVAEVPSEVGGPSKCPPKCPPDELALQMWRKVPSENLFGPPKNFHVRN